MTAAPNPLREALQECAAACDACFHACLLEEHVQHMVRCIELDRDCADLCRLTASFAIRQSELIPEVLIACAEACARCAAECERHPEEHCRTCAEACRRCEQACREASQSNNALRTAA